MHEATTASDANLSILILSLNSALRLERNSGHNPLQQQQQGWPRASLTGILLLLEHTHAGAAVRYLVHRRRRKSAHHETDNKCTQTACFWWKSLGGLLGVNVVPRASSYFDFPSACSLRITMMIVQKSI